jgi:uncharacterized protein
MNTYHVVLKTHPLLSEIISDINSRYQPHTLILYGSLARGDSSETSDYDIIGICCRWLSKPA